MTEQLPFGAGEGGWGEWGERSAAAQSGQSVADARAADDDQLLSLLRRAVTDLRGPRATIATLDRVPSAAASSYAAEVLTVTLTTGELLSFFLKDLGTTAIAKDQPHRRRERELAVYRDLLSVADLGTPRYFGSAWEPSHERFWLLLELVSGSPVRHSPFEAWLAAAAWLGRLHAFFAQHTELVRGCDWLLRYDAEFLLAQADAAARHVAQVSRALSNQLGPSLERYLERAVPAMLAWPATLVHGHYRPYNILVDLTTTPPRVCPVDWERAGLGPPAYDFAYLAEGFDPERLDQLGEAYRAEASRHGLVVPEPEELGYLANAFRVHRMLSLLGSAVDRGFTEPEVVKLVTLVSQLCKSC